MTCVVQITGESRVGKTAMAEVLIRRLKAAGFRVVAVKLSHHEPESRDRDTSRMREAGADVVVFYNGRLLVTYSRELYCGFLGADYIVIEGGRGLKLGYKVHLGPGPPSDADVVLGGPSEALEVRCVEADPCEVLSRLVGLDAGGGI